ANRIGTPSSRTSSVASRMSLCPSFKAKLGGSYLFCRNRSWRRSKVRWRPLAPVRTATHDVCTYRRQSRAGPDGGRCSIASRAEVRAVLVEDVSLFARELSQAKSHGLLTTLTTTRSATLAPVNAPRLLIYFGLSKAGMLAHLAAPSPTTMNGP